MNFLASDEQIKIKVVKKEEMAARKEAGRKSLFGSSPTASAGTPATAEAARTISPHLIGTPAGLGALAAANAPAVPPGGVVASALAVPAPKKCEPKVQLVEVETGLYDIYFTCQCAEQYIIRCESLDKAAEAPVPSAS